MSRPKKANAGNRHWPKTYTHTRQGSAGQVTRITAAALGSLESGEKDETNAPDSQLRPVAVFFARPPSHGDGFASFPDNARCRLSTHGEYFLIVRSRNRMLGLPGRLALLVPFLTAAEAMKQAHLTSGILHSRFQHFHTKLFLAFLSQGCHMEAVKPSHVNARKRGSQ